MASDDTAARKTDSTVTQSHSEHNEGVGTKLWNGAYNTACALGREGKLLTVSVWEAAQDCAKSGKAFKEAAAGAGLGFTLGFLQREAGMMRLLSESAVAILAVQCWTDTMNTNRLRKIGSSVADAWQSDQHMSKDLAIMKATFGNFVIDNLIMLRASDQFARYGQALSRRMFCDKLASYDISAYGSEKIEAGQGNADIAKRASGRRKSPDPSLQKLTRVIQEGFRVDDTVVSLPLRSCCRSIRRLGRCP